MGFVFSLILSVSAILLIYLINLVLVYSLWRAVILVLLIKVIGLIKYRNMLTDIDFY